MTHIITPAQTCGPLFGFALFPESLQGTAKAGSTDAITIEGRVVDGAGESVGYGAFLEFWCEGQATRVRTLDGHFRTVMKKPAATEVPGLGRLAPHIHVAIFTRGLARPLVTRMYFPDEAATNAQDPVLSLLEPERQAVLLARPGVDGSHWLFDIRLQGEGEAVFFVVDEA
jgi:protocatechuate 3,4-dioxygenase, alpha subunit